MNNSEKNKPILSIMSVAPGSFDADYKILEEIGRGGFSVVYACQSYATKKIFAVKVCLRSKIVYIILL
jgi:hypothetical protein